MVSFTLFPMTVDEILEFQHTLKGKVPEVSFSYRLAETNSEFLYEYWFHTYQKYLAAARENLDSARVSQLDIKSYYTCISQERLVNLLRERIDSTRSLEILTPVVLRECYGKSDDGYGIIQGHTLSGIFGNLVLQPLDSLLVQKHGFADRYFRFTDDIIITKSSVPDNDVNVVQASLSQLDKKLCLNDSKLRHIDSNEFSQKLRGTKDLNDLSLRFRALMLPLYLMNINYQIRKNTTRRAFVYQYQHLLQNLGVYISPEWLYRKLDEYGKPRRWLTKQFDSSRRWKLKWPSLSLLENSSGESEWLAKFQELNKDWYKEKEAIHTTLSSMFRYEATVLLKSQGDQPENRKHIRRLKFSLHRLSIFGIESVVDPAVELLIRKPWYIPVKLTCQALARINMHEYLTLVHTQTSSEYVRACALKGLGKVRSNDSARYLIQSLTHQSSVIERLMASEALIEACAFEGLNYDQIVNWAQDAKDYPYLQKNFIVLLGHAFPNTSKDFLRQLERGDIHPIVSRAIHYSLSKNLTENLLQRPDPSTLEKYRAKYYPLIEELLDEVGSSQVAVND